jgi:hypothetical protein
MDKYKYQPICRMGSMIELVVARHDMTRCKQAGVSTKTVKWRNRMSLSMRNLVATAMVAASLAAGAGAAAAMPFADAMAIKNAAPAAVETVGWGGHGGGGGGHWGGGGWGGGHGWGGHGWGGGGFVAGAILGGALAAPYYYGGGPYYGPGAYYGPGPYYGDPGPYADPAGGDPVAFCLAHFRSYDPRSGTYLGFDGQRHPCP